MHLSSQNESSEEVSLRGDVITGVLTRKHGH